MFKAGDRVADHLELVRLLGAGGMGSVWVAQHLRLRNQVAVKFLSASMLNNPAARSRFDREAQWVAQVKSPHVVQVLDQGVTAAVPPQPYIVMELLEGEDLGRLLDRVGRLGLSDAVYILDQACAGLAAAHAVGLVHRDIKPENLFLMAGERPFVKILDFGIARATQDVELNRLTQTGGVIGTAHYMSPEQLFEGKQVDHRTDVWALGVVTYRMLTGNLPFDGNTYGDLCLAVNQGRYAPPSGSAAMLSPEVDAFMARALATDRNQRFTSVREFRQALGALAQRPSGSHEHPLAQLPLDTRSQSGAVAATTGPSAKSGPRDSHTKTDATITLESVPLNRHGVVITAVAGALLVSLAAAFGAYKFWSAGGEPKGDGNTQAEQSPAGSDSVASEAAEKPSAVVDVALTTAAEAASSSATATQPREPEHAPAQKGTFIATTRTPATKRAKSNTKPTDTPPTPNEAGSTKNVKPNGSTTGTAPQVAKPKYRGF